MRTLAQTAELPAVESLADICRDDPERIFTHREPTPKPRPAREWSPDALDRLLNDTRSLPCRTCKKPR